MEQSLAPNIVVATHTETYGRFIVEPLRQGFGVTLGNALRRVLLGSLPGMAITAVQIEGVQHEYSTLPHVQEDMIDFLLNLKGIRIRSLTNHPGVLHLEVSGRAGAVTAGDIQPSGDYEILNPEIELLHLDGTAARFSAELHVQQGTGYSATEARESQVIGLLPVDAVFTPIRRVNFEVEPTRVGQNIDYDRLILEVWTDKTMTPQTAVQQSAQILVDHFMPFAALGRPVLPGAERRSITDSIPRTLASMSIEEMKLSSRTQNSLRRGNLSTVGSVLERSPEELLALRNFGDRSLEELYEKLRSLGVPIPDGDDKRWHKEPLADFLRPASERATAEEESAAIGSAVYSSHSADETEEEEVDVSAFRGRSFSPDDDTEEKR